MRNEVFCIVKHRINFYVGMYVRAGTEFDLTDEIGVYSDVVKTQRTFLSRFRKL